MKLIGLTGSIGSGKSTVSSILKEQGGYIIDCDQISREVNGRADVQRELIDTFGGEIVDEQGAIDRKALGSIVFSDKAKLRALEYIVHKHILEEIYARLAEARSQEGKYSFIVIDAPLLIEANLHKIVDSVWVVTTEESQRISRVNKRDSLSIEEIKKRIENQTPSQQLVHHAHVVIDNNGSIEQLKEEVIKCVQNLK